MKWLAPIICVSLGLAAGYALSEAALVDSFPRHTARPVATAPEDPVPVEPGGARPQGPTLVGSEVTSEARSSGASGAQVALTDLPGRLERALAELPTRAVGEIAGVIRVQALDEAEQPVAGVEVALRPVGLPNGVEPIDLVQNDLEEYVRRRVDEQRYLSAIRRSGATDANGTLEFGDVVSGCYRVEPGGDGFQFQVDVEGQNNSVVVPGNSVTIRVSPASTLPVLVLLPDGTPALNATIEVRDTTGSQRRLAWSQGQPNLRLQPGRYQVSAELNELFEAEPQEVVVSSTEPTPRLLIRLQPSRRLLIEVVADGVVDGVPVALFWREADGEVDTNLLAADSYEQQLSFKQGKVQHSVPDLVPGPYWVGASYHEERVDVATRIELGTEAQTVHLTLPPLGSQEQLRFVVLAADGTRPEDVMIQLLVGEQNLHGGVRQFREADGTIVLLPGPEVARQRASQDGKLRARVVVSDLGSRTVPVEVGETVVRFAAAGRLEVEVLGATRDGWDSIYLTLRPVGDSEPQGGTSFSRSSEPSDTNPKFTATAEAGEYWLEGQLSEVISLPRERVRLAPGSQTMTVQLPATHRLVVEIPEGTESGSTVLMSTRHQVSGLSPTHVDGRAATFDGVPAGDYYLMVGEQFMRLRVTGAQQTPFVALRLNALEVAMDEELTELHGLRSGDLIVAVAGKSFEGAEEVQLAFASFTDGEGFELEVLRAGQRVPIALDPEQSQDLERHFNFGRVTLLPAQQ
ncbi:MAG: hypothetical protein AB7O52_17890 [Planctomycetota bacterium]